mmetsp:Transcript_10104/g.31811  ORF Transcript_10104/g.31811 Transcript_10104/m.31811 type:complete len:333 (-) Transcript_10104:198-1196(-)
MPPPCQGFAIARLRCRRCSPARTPPASCSSSAMNHWTSLGSCPRSSSSPAPRRRRARRQATSSSTLAAPRQLRTPRSTVSRAAGGRWRRPRRASRRSSSPRSFAPGRRPARRRRRSGASRTGTGGPLCERRRPWSSPPFAGAETAAAAATAAVGAAAVAQAAAATAAAAAAPEPPAPRSRGAGRQNHLKPAPPLPPHRWSGGTWDHFVRRTAWARPRPGSWQRKCSGISPSRAPWTWGHCGRSRRLVRASTACSSSGPRSTMALGSGGWPPCRTWRLSWIQGVRHSTRTVPRPCDGGELTRCSKLGIQVQTAARSMHRLAPSSLGVLATALP